MSAPRLLGITPGDGRELLPWLDALADAGLPGLLIRELDAEAEVVEQLVTAASTRFPWVYLHARCAGATRLAHRVTGLHHPDDGAAAAGPHGRSCHHPQQVHDALAEGAHYALLSPIWAPGSKPDDTRTPMGPDALLPFADQPVLALGGVTVARYHQLRARGAHGAAGIGIAFSGTPGQVRARIRAALQGPSPASS